MKETKIQDSGAECCVRVVGGAVQLMSDFQMSRVSRSGYRLYCRGCHRPRPPPFKRGDCFRFRSIREGSSSD